MSVSRIEADREYAITMIEDAKEKKRRAEETIKEADSVIESKETQVKEFDERLAIPGAVVDAIATKRKASDKKTGTKSKARKSDSATDSDSKKDSGSKGSAGSKSDSDSSGGSSSKAGSKRDDRDSKAAAAGEPSGDVTRPDTPEGQSQPAGSGNTKPAKDDPNSKPLI